MTDVVSWAGPLIRAGEALKLTEKLLEDRKTREAMLALVEARRAMDDVVEFVLKARAT